MVQIKLFNSSDSYYQRGSNFEKAVNEFCASHDVINVQMCDCDNVITIMVEYEVAKERSKRPMEMNVKIE